MDVPVLAVTTGEPAGVGPDLALRLTEFGTGSRCVLIGDKAMLAARARQLGLSLTLHDYAPGAPAPKQGLEVCDVPLAAAAVPGRLDPANASYVLATLDRAIDGCLAGEFAAMVTAPVHKGVINDGGVAFSGHTEYLAERTRTSKVVMMLAGGGMRVALATTHLSLRDVPDAITTDSLEQVIRILLADLRVKFGIAAPRVLVAGLNPHAGESGHLGREEIEIIEPLLTRLRGEGLDLIGPLPADTLFNPDKLRHCDAVLAMYHDQGLPVLKHASFGAGINITLGLPIIRTSVDHGTALDLAGSGRAHPGSLFEAVQLATQLAVTAGN
ncbi:4-hydroxythreonine-4-phosphate dehydrogenase PdxA [Chromobacterium haemolyticum]|uniref:4-hydroxythreonine-4-phosphate dehydrogenase n=1 Tax=Chromobacterium haemolyticum TaxID=394935 RepID=A0ABS3GNP9_9NEIS|nr:4-hydroxythreonine-4-phosphate dehydrogenase PdxA [Chromobacterium haemolyticum]MBK0414833.1 4-hydroxythreonine-4-phosphate dehydrogenase PdxA [Chromobacterium haemolyticum]MBO0416212.1 4-hydroxythreonine-4-phosphate dehydrogenase PdxA [Chromobacterium haemolyticum]MBO0499289.1 4-hydroxythreonine-4-phosphate dehydrogenase PdxA [Chromobacterium haemolyticum]